MNGLGSTHSHDTHHAYMGRGTTPKSCVGFVCLKSHLFCHWQANGKWLTILESLKKKKENKQGFSYELTQQTTKVYSFCGVHLGLLPQTFRVRLLARVDLGLFLYHNLYLIPLCLHVQFSEDMCTSSLDCWIH